MSSAAIRVKSVIKQAGESDHNVEIITTGKVYLKDGIIFVFYDESEISGMQGTKTMLKIKEDFVQMSRSGTNVSKLIFEPGINHESNYGTPYGEFIMETSTKSIKIDVDEKLVGKIQVEYHLMIRGLSDSDHILDIEILSVSDD
jgi:uncharacterized beta-barrel protein YwiB (DUF1934 family)